MAIGVQLFTADFIIRGQVETDGERLTDVLNLKTDPQLILSEVQSSSLFTLGKSPPLRLARARLEKKAILMAIPLEQDLTHKSIFRKTNRVGVDVAVLLPQFEIHGMLHVVERLDIRKGLMMRPEDFIPLTDATLTYVFNPQLSLHSGAMIFNKNHMSLLGEGRVRPAAEGAV